MDKSNFINPVKRAASMIMDARYVVAFTGAGISTPSGIPDFRSEKNGLWQRYDPMQVASRSAFFHSPDLFFDWFRPLFMTSWKAQPNAAHLGLAMLEQNGYLQSLITQNIDGLHQKAGSSTVLELHGTALTFSCSRCQKQTSSESVFDQFTSGSKTPHCSLCSATLKPDVVLFEEGLPQNTWEKAEDETQKSDLMLIAGSSLEVYPANTLPQAAFQHGCKIIINNLTRTPLDEIADLCIPMDVAKFFPLLLEQFKID